MDFPRKGADGKYIDKVRIRVLHQGETERARLSATMNLIERHGVKAELHDARGIRDLLTDKVTKEILAATVLEVEPYNDDPDHPQYARVFSKGDDLDYCTGDEIATLYAGYLMVQQRFGPHEGNLMSRAEITAWIKTLEEGARGFPLSLLSSHQRVTLTTCLAQRSSTLSAILESHIERLPQSLASELTMLGIGIGLFGKPAATSTDTPLIDWALKLRDLTVDEAAEVIAVETGELRERGEITMEAMADFAAGLSGVNYDDPDYQD